MAWYRVKTGLNFPDGDGERRLEPGDVTDQLPEASVGWLLDGGHIEAAAAPEPVPEAVPQPTEPEAQEVTSGEGPR